jgi:hypothetical protein
VADADAASGDESDLQAWADFDEQVKADGAFVLNGAPAPASTGARLVQTAIAGHALDEAVERRPFAEGEWQIQAFYIMDLPSMDAALEWANRLPTYGDVEVRELLQFAPARQQPLSYPAHPHQRWTTLLDGLRDARRAALLTAAGHARAGRLRCRSGRWAWAPVTGPCW